MRAKLKSIKIENFMSFRDAEKSFPDRGVVFVEGENRDEGGSNGAGKSAVFEALIWALTGKILRDLSDRGKDYIRKGAKECSVCLRLIKDGIEHTIERKRNGGVKVFLDGEEVTDEQIYKFVGVDLVGITNSLIFGQSITERFILLTDAEKKEILSKILGYDVFLRASELAREKSKRLQSKILKIDTSIFGDSKVIETKREDIKSNRRDIEELVKEKEFAESKSKSRKEHIEKELSGKKNSLEVYKTNLDDIKKREKILSEEASRIASDLTNVKIARTKTKTSISAINKDKKDLLDMLEKLEKQQVCSLCKRKFDKKGREAVRESYRALISAKQSLLDSLVEELKNYDKDIPFLEEESKKKSLEKERCSKDRDSMNEKIVQVSSEISALEQDLRNLNADLSIFDARISELNERINKDEKKIRELEEKRKEYERDKSSLLHDKEIYDFWVTGFGKAGMISFLLEPDVEFLGRRVNAHLSQFSKFIKLDISTKTELKSNKIKDSLSINVVNQKGGGSYRLSSGGERKRMDIAMILGLRDLVRSRYGNALGIFVADEIFDSVDTEGLGTICDRLSELDDLVFVLSHNDDLKKHFPLSMKVVKQDGISRFEN